MKKILVALDGSPFAEQAIDPARHLAARQGAELHLASVVEDVPSTFLAVDAIELAGHWLEAEESRANEYLEELERTLSEDGASPIHSHVRQGPAARTLVELARELEADLIVSTSHGRGGLKRLWLGSTADRLLRLSSVPLLLLRPREPGEPAAFGRAGHPGHILVPLDGSEAAKSVLRDLDLVIPTEGGRVTLVSVLHHPVPFPAIHFPDSMEDKATLEQEKGRLRDYLQGVQRRLEAGGAGSVAVRILEHADVARILVEFCEKEGVDLIAMTTHGRGTLGRTFLGSVADKLVRGTDLPVLALRMPEEGS